MEAVPGLKLDPATLLFSISVLGFLMAAVSFSSAGAIPKQRFGLQEWGKAMTAAGGGFLLYWLRGYGPWILTFLVANVLVMAAAVYGLLAHAQLFEAVAPRKTLAIVAAVGMGGVLAAYFDAAPRQVAVFTLSSAMAVLLAMIAAMVIRNTARRKMPAAWIASTVVTTMAAAFAMRAVLSAFGDASSVSPSANSGPQIGSLLTGALFIVAASIGFLSMVHDRQRREALELMRRDGLTGLYTRSAFFELAEQVDNASSPEAYAVVMVDIDHFKRINDTYGHAGGDVTLAHAGRLIASSVRISDIAGRYGGEEFCILLRGCDEAQAAQFAQRLVSQSRQQTVRLRDGRNATFTLSAGYAYRSTSSATSGRRETLNEALERADQALYRAKRGGRNQAIAALPVGSGAPA